MGHLIHPTAFRLNYFKSWEDTWFVKNIYYPEFLNSILKLRNYLYFFLTDKKVLRSGIFLSHFFLLKYNKLLLINLFIYQIDLEKLSFESINNLYSSFFDYKRNFKIKKSNNFFKLVSINIDLYLLILLFVKMFYATTITRKMVNKNNMIKFYLNLNFFFNSENFIEYYNLILDNFNEKIVNKLLYKKDIYTLCDKSLKIAGNFKDKYLRQFNFKYKYLNDLDENFCELNMIFNTNIQFIMFLLKRLTFSYTDKSFEKLVKLRSLIVYLNVFKFIDYKLESIKLNFNFLLYYLSGLLKRMLLNYKGERYFMVRDNIYRLLYNLFGLNHFFKEFNLIINFLNNIIYIITKIKYVNYKIFFLSNKNITARWLSRYIGLRLRNNYSFNTVINPIKRELRKLCRWNSKKRYNKLNILMNKNNMKFKIKFKDVMRNYFALYFSEYFRFYVLNNNYMYDWFIYFNNKFIIKNYNLLKFSKNYKCIYITIFFSNYWKLNFFNDREIVEDVICKIYNFKLINLSKKFRVILKNFFILPFFINNLFKFHYFKYLWLSSKNINLRNMRNNYVNKSLSILIGYKLIFKGRFSRKQRASSIWLMKGKIPLNTLSIQIDYSFFTIPIKNSAISVKIMLYKNISKEKYKYVLII
jgi:hypothetical protein